MEAFREMGFDMTEGQHDGLEQMDDDKSDDEKEDDNEKHDGECLRFQKQRRHANGDLAFGADFPTVDYDEDE